VWGLAGSQPYRFNFTSNAFEPVPGTLTSISVRDWSAVWGLNGTDIFRWDVLSNTFKPVPGQLTSIATWDSAANNVWGLLGSDPGFRGTQSGGIFRFDIGSNSFKQVPGQLSSIYVGAANPDINPAQVWGLNDGEIFHWDWDSNSFKQVLQQEHVGEAAPQSLSVGYSEVWGLVNDLVFRFNFISNGFEFIPGTTLTDISVLDPNTVWGLSGAWHQDSDIFWFDPDLKNWKQIPGKLARLSVGVSSVGISENINYEVWGLNVNGDVFRSVTFARGPMP
jgi:hypothetical protein